MKTKNFKNSVLFFTFLFDNQLLDSFLDNLDGKSVYRYLLTVDPANYLYCAFDWSKTEEGVLFWSEFNASWTSRLNAFKKSNL